MFKTITIAAVTAAILAAGLQTASARLSMNGGGENGLQLNGGGENGKELNGGGENGLEPQGKELNGGGENSRSAQGVGVSGAISTGLVVLAVELPPVQQ